MLRKLALASLASFILLTPALVTAHTASFRIEEATIEDIQGAIMRGELTSTRLVQLYLNRIKAYNGTCVNQPDGLLGTITPNKNAHQLNALMTLNLNPNSAFATIGKSYCVVPGACEPTTICVLRMSSNFCTGAVCHT